MDPKYSFSYVHILDSARLRHLLKKNEIDFDKVFEEINVVQADPPKADINQSIGFVEKQLEEQKKRFDNAIKFRHIISRLTLTRRMTPTLKYFLMTIDNMITAESNGYQTLLNYLELKRCLRETMKTGHWNNDDWPEITETAV